MVRQEDVIYGRKHGMALTMDVFKPDVPNGIGLIYTVAGGWRSYKEAIGDGSTYTVKPYVDAGYTVFAAVLCSVPKFAIPDLVEDVHRAVRFVRFNAKEYGVNPDALGIYGGSAGGHLSLLIANTGREGDPEAEDPVERVSSQVQAVAEFYGPTDFRNYGSTGQLAMVDGPLSHLGFAFDFQEFDETDRKFHSVVDSEAFDRKLCEISPITHVDSASPPTYIVHGDADTLVPLQQSELLIAKLKEHGVPCGLLVKEGGGHSWPEMEVEAAELVAWFDRYLLG